MSYLWTSEAVSAGHPDKVADQLADTVLDLYLADNPRTRVACEVTCMKDEVLVTGEVGGDKMISTEKAIVGKLVEIGYDRAENGFDGNVVNIRDKMNWQSEEISNAVAKEDGEYGAGDQGLMFGYACDETIPEYMPLAHHLAFQLINFMEADIKAGRKDGKWNSPFLPDAKSQVTIRCLNDGTPIAIDTIVISTQHQEGFPLGDLKGYIRHNVINPLKEKYDKLFYDNTRLIIQPSGPWHKGGPAADTGLSGRKIVVDNYGADCPIGGGSFSGKDPTKVDRSAAYAARHIAKNIVAGKLAKKARVQLAYAIGVIKPVSIRVESLHTSKHNNQELTKMVEDVVDLTPRGIINYLNLQSPIYAKTAKGGHFGSGNFTWERLDLVETFQDYFNH